jgi:hypothetical protein
MRCTTKLSLIARTPGVTSAATRTACFSVSESTIPHRSRFPSWTMTLTDENRLHDSASSHQFLAYDQVIHALGQAPYLSAEYQESHPQADLQAHSDRENRGRSSIWSEPTQTRLAARCHRTIARDHAISEDPIELKSTVDGTLLTRRL